MSGVRAAAITGCVSLAGFLSVGCEQAPGRVGERTVVDSAGVEIVTLPTLPGLNDPDYRWTTEIEIEIETQPGGDLSEPIVYGPSRIIPLSEDTILVVDQRGPDPLVMVSLPDGRVVRRLGSWGEGPLEISQVRAAWRDRSGSIGVLDGWGRKVVSFAPDGGVSMVPVAVAGGMPINAAYADRRDGPPVIAFGTDVGDTHLNLAIGTLEPADSSLVATLVHPMPYLAPGYFRARNVWTAVPTGIVTFRTDQPEYRILTRDGGVERLIRVPLTERTVTRMEVQRSAAERSRSAEEAQLPSREAGPIATTNNVYAFGDSVFGTFQSEMWRAVEDDVPDVFAVLRLFSTSGHYMGTIEYLLREFVPQWIGGGVVWGVASDSLGVAVIQRRRLIPPPGVADR